CRRESLTMTGRLWRGLGVTGALVVASAAALAVTAYEPPPLPSPAPSPSSPPSTPPAEPAADPAPGEGMEPEGLPLEQGGGLEDLDETGPREATVYLKDGQRFTGLLVEQAEGYLVVRIEGIPTRFPLKDVDRV